MIRLVSPLAIGACILASTASPSFAASQSGCANDSKLLNGGPTNVFGEGPGTYWNLIEGGLQAAFGDNEQAKIQYLSGVFGQPFTTLDQARDYNLQGLSDAFDANGDGVVCVYDQRGTRANLEDPFSQYTYFSIGDDKPKKGSNK